MNRHCHSQGPLHARSDIYASYRCIWWHNTCQGQVCCHQPTPVTPPLRSNSLQAPFFTLLVSNLLCPQVTQVPVPTLRPSLRTKKDWRGQYRLVASSTSCSVPLARDSNSLPHSLTHSLPHSLTLSLTYTHTLTHSLTYTHTHTHTHTDTHSLTF